MRNFNRSGKTRLRSNVVDESQRASAALYCDEWLVSSVRGKTRLSANTGLKNALKMEIPYLHEETNDNPLKSEGVMGEFSALSYLIYSAD